MINIGPAGSDNNFKLKGYKNSYDIPKYLNDLGLNAFEYQCSRGVKISDEIASKLKDESLKYNINLSVHSPYYISLSTQDADKQINTIKYITDTMIAAKKMGAKRVVVHAGSLLDLDREFAVESACKLLKRAIDEADKLGLYDIVICPETMGKINQLGTSSEIIDMCKVDDRIIPTIDFGHLYCRSLGVLNTEELFKKELMLYINELGYERMKNFHAHFSRMEYTQNGGEKNHVTLDEIEYGPDFDKICRALIKLNLEPTIICESAGTQSLDAVKMLNIYNEILGDK